MTNQAPGLLVMDVDSTLITAEVIELLAERAGSREEVAAVTEAAMRGELDFEASLQQRVATLAGLPQSVFLEVLADLTLTAGARELVSQIQAAGWTVGLVSGGFHELVDPLAQQLNITHVRANRLEVQDGVLTGRTTGPVVDRTTKRETLAQWAEELQVPLASTVAIGDGANDIEMLQSAGLGVAFRPKPALERVADLVITERLDDILPHLAQVLSTAEQPRQEGTA